MALTDFLFGSEPSTETQQLNRLSQPQQRSVAPLERFIHANAPGAANAEFRGELVAPLSKLEQVSLTGLEERAKKLAVGDPQLQAASEALVEIINRGPADIEEFFQTNIKAPILETFDEDIRPRIGARFADQFFGSDRRRADQRSEEELIETLARERARVALEGRESDTSAVLQAIGLAPGTAGAGTNELLQLLQAGSVPREVQTQGLQAEFERSKQTERTRLDRAKLIAAFLGIPTTENVVIENQGSSGLLGGLLGPIGGAIAGPVGAAVGTKLATVF